MGAPATAAVKGLKPRAPTAPRALATPAASAPAPISAVTVAPSAAVAPATPVTPVTPVTPRNPRSSAVECKTVREILPPWEVLQEKLNKKSTPAPARNEVLNQGAQQALAAQEAANSLWSPPASKSSSPSYAQSYESIEAPPSSGVRMSDSGPAAAEIGAMPDSLSFKVYTVADLERRSDAPVSIRSSRGSFDLTSSRSSLHWHRAGIALRELVSASVAWLKTKGERPSAKVALRKPFDNLGDELQVAVESIDWRKLGVTTGIVVGAGLTLLFAVLTAAELTDDLKPPGSAAHLASTETTPLPAKTAIGARGVAPATNMAAMGVQPVAVAVAPEPAPEPSTVIGDIDTPESPAAAPAKKATAKKPKAAKKLPLRNAPF